MLAWGYLEYAGPLTEKEMNDYELKPAPVKHEKETVENRPDDLRPREDILRFFQRRKHSIRNIVQ